MGLRRARAVRNTNDGLTRRAGGSTKPVTLKNWLGASASSMIAAALYMDSVQGWLERSEHSVEEVACDPCHQGAVVGDGDFEESIAVRTGVISVVSVLAGDQGGDGGGA